MYVSNVKPTQHVGSAPLSYPAANMTRENQRQRYIANRRPIRAGCTRTRSGRLDDRAAIVLADRACRVRRSRGVICGMIGESMTEKANAHRRQRRPKGTDLRDQQASNRRSPAALRSRMIVVPVGSIQQARAIMRSTSFACRPPCGWKWTAATLRSTIDRECDRSCAQSGRHS